MSADITDYTDLITSEHADKPDFVSTVSALLQGFVDCNNILQSVPGMFDIDVARGEQLDFVGEWVGFSRNLTVPIPGVYFAFDTAGVGFDEGILFNPLDPAEGIISLDDTTYRLILFVQIASHLWDGSLEQAESILASVLVGYPNTHLFIEDNLDMSITIGVVGTPPSALFQALLTGGYFELRPAGVRITGVVISTGPLFGFDIENYNVSGFDVGILT